MDIVEADLLGRERVVDGFADCVGYWDPAGSWTGPNSHRCHGHGVDTGVQPREVWDLKGQNVISVIDDH